jgi:SSS family solute:Na+ symporter
MPSKSLLLPDYAVVALYLVAILAGGFWFARVTKSGRDFFVGGNRIPWWAAGISLYMTTFSAWMFTGAASFVYNTSWFGILFLAVKPFGFLVGFLLSAVRWRRSRLTSPVEYVEERFNHITRLVLSVLLVLSMMYWPGHHLASLSKIAAPALLPDVPWAIDGLIIFFGIFVLVYTVAGGIWAVSITDVLQFLVLFSVCTVLVVAVVASGEMGSVANFIAAAPPLEFTHTIRQDTVYTHWYLIGFLVSGIFGNVVGDKAQRFFIVRDDRAARKSGWLAFALFLTSPLLFGLPPLVGRVLWPEIGQLVPFAGTSKPDESIFIAVVMHYLPTGVVGLFLAAMIAASMSALDSVWNAVSAVVSVDLYKGHLRSGATDRELLWVGRITVVVLACAAVAMALVIVHSPIGIFTFSNMVLGLVAIPVTVPLFVGIVSRSPLSWSAVPSIVSGILIAADTRFELDWSLGPQYLAVVLVALIPLFSSRWLGSLFLRRPLRARAAALGIAALTWGGFALAEAPTMAPGVSRGGAEAPWLLVCIATIALLTIVFLPLYARELRHPPEPLEGFFARLRRPVEAEAEVGKETHEGSPNAIVGWCAAGLGIVPLVLWVISGAENGTILLTLAALLLGVSMLFFRASSHSA